MMCTYFTTEIINIETISLHKSFPGKFHFSNHPGNKLNYSRFFFPEVIFRDRREVDIDSESLIYVQKSPFSGITPKNH